MGEHLEYRVRASKHSTLTHKGRTGVDKLDMSAVAFESSEKCAESIRFDVYLRSCLN